uniref:Transposase n=1 Tax=Caenorhabditis tropicalis TaxID=1561998 RepID=A0A1I7UJ47_9PELO
MKKTGYQLMTPDVESLKKPAEDEQQPQVPYSDELKYRPTNALKERWIEFMEYYFGPVKLYLKSYPMPDGMWNNRKYRLKASGVQVVPRVEPRKPKDRLIIIVQKQPHSDKKIK